MPDNYELNNLDDTSLGDIFKEFHEERFYKPWMEGVTFTLLDTMESVKDYFLEAARSGAEYIAIDTETTGLNVKTVRLVGISLSYRGCECAYIPLLHDNALNVDTETFLLFFKSILNKFKWVFYNSKYDTEVLFYHGVEMFSQKHYEDAMLLVYLHDSNKAKNNIGLKASTKYYLNKEMIKFTELVPNTEEGEEAGFMRVPTNLALIYAGSDALFTRELYEKFKYIKESRQSFIYKLETKLIDVVRQMERNGIDIDIFYFQTLRGRIRAKIDILIKEIFELCGKPLNSFNLDSPQQVGDIFFMELGIKNPHKTESGNFKVSGDVMSELADETGHPVLLKYKEYRQLQKVLSSYIEPFLEDETLERGHVSFKQMHVPTGRFASGGGGRGSHYLNINIQSIPGVVPAKRKGIKKITMSDMGGDHFLYYGLFEWDDELYCKEDCSKCPFSNVCVREFMKDDFVCDTSYNIRRGFICRDPNKQLFTIDFSGVELRMVTNITKEPKWLNEFLHGSGDLHTITAMDIFGITDRLLVEKSQRSLGKVVNFGSLYGGGPGTLMRTVNSSAGPDDQITLDFSKKVLENFWSGIPYIDTWRKQIWEFARKTGEAYTYLGRKRPIPESLLRPTPDMSDEDIKNVAGINAKGDRNAANHVVQGSSADLMKLAMLRCHQEIKKRGWVGKLKMLLSIHDELVFECDKDIIFEAMKVMSSCMQVSIEGFEVPFETDIEYSDRRISNWGMTTECRFWEEDGRIYPTKYLKGASSKGIHLYEYLREIGKDSYIPEVPDVGLSSEVTNDEDSNRESSEINFTLSTSNTNSKKCDKPDGNSIEDSFSSLRLTMEDKFKDITEFDFTHLQRTDQLARQLKYLISSEKGKSNILLIFETEKYLIRDVNLEGFDRAYNIFFSKK